MRRWTMSLLGVLLFCSAAAVEPAAKPAVIDAGKYPSLQAAMDAVPEAGGMVVLPPGEFELTQPLELNRGETRIEGAGASTHLINRNTEGRPALLIQPKNRDTDRKARIWRVQIANFRISGTTNSGDGLHAEAVQEIFIHGLSVDHHGGHGVNLVDCFEDPRVSDSIFTYNAKAGLNITNCHDIVVNANHFEENLDALVCADSFNLCMNGNNVDDHLRNGVVIENTYGSVVSGNMIEECNGTAVIFDRDCYGITVSANVIAHHLGGGADLRDAWGCAFSANTFVLAHTNSIVVGPNSGRITITGNNFSNSHIGGGDKREPASKAKTPMQRDAGGGVRIDGASDVTITGNTFSGVDGPAVAAEGACRGIVVTGNVVVDAGRLDKSKPPMSGLENLPESVVKDNVVRGAP